MGLHARLLLLACTLLRPIHSQDIWGGDLTSHENFLIARCGKDISGGKADQLINFLRELGGDLPRIIIEAQSGSRSPYGFKALFTSDQSIPVVTAAFSNISDTASFPNPRKEQITFVCLEPGDPFTSQIYHFVNSTHPSLAFNEFDSPNIYLCPSFFDGTAPRPKPYHCPLFRRDAIARNADDILSTTQYGIIIHELIDKYLHPHFLNQSEYYNLRECMKLPQAQQLQNAENYNFFASCEYYQRVETGNV